MTPVFFLSFNQEWDKDQMSIGIKYLNRSIWWRRIHSAAAPTVLTLIFDLRDVGHLPDGIRIDCVDDGHIVGHNAAVGRPLRVRHDDPLREVGEHAEVVTNEEGVGHEGQLLAA